MSTTIEILTQRIEAMEQQILSINRILDTNGIVEKNTEQPAKKEKKPKKEKKEKSASSDDEKTKPKRVSGYILYSKAMREEATETVRAAMEGDGDKIKSTEVMKELGRMWKALTAEEQEPWNTQAKAPEEEE